jgi:hypothetical protein
MKLLSEGKRVFLACLAAALLGALAITVPATAAPATAASPHALISDRRAEVNKHRAVSAYRAMQKRYYIDRKELYRGDPYANAWPYGQALAATISVASLPGMRSGFRKDVRARLRGLEAYADRRSPPPAGYLSKVGPPHGRGGDRYVDDNLWFGIELARVQHVLGLPTLDKAKRVFAMATSYWDVRPQVPCPGGLFWAPLISGDRNTVSNAPAAQLGAQLYLRTGQPFYLTQAKRAYEWVRGCLLTPSGLYYDHIDRRGRIDTAQWTYNQGTMIGAGVLLYQATKDRGYLDQARLTAEAALRTYQRKTLDSQPDFFTAIYIRNLLLLGSTIGDPRYRDFAQWFAASEWRDGRDHRNGLFTGRRGGERLLDQAGMVQVYGMLVAGPQTYF